MDEVVDRYPIAALYSMEIRGKKESFAGRRFPTTLRCQTVDQVCSVRADLGDSTASASFPLQPRNMKCLRVHTACQGSQTRGDIQAIEHVMLNTLGTSDNDSCK